MKHLIYIALFFLFMGCYEDKGNYDYTPVNRLEIEKFSRANTYYFGDTLRIVPDFTFSIDSTEKHLSYEWTVLGNRKLTTRNLEWPIDTVGAGYLVLRVKDEETGIVAVQEKYIELKSEYETDGFMILSRGENNESILSYIRQSSNEKYYAWGEGTETNYYKYDDFYNIYEKINQAPLGKSPVRIMQHFLGKYGKTTGSFWVLQKDPDCVDVSGVTFEKDVTLRSQFEPEVPSDFQAYDMVDMYWSTFIIGKDGKMYARKKVTDELFNTGSFLADPVVFEENGKVTEIRGDGVIHHRNSIGYTMLYEKNLKRFLLLIDRSQKEACKVEAPDAPAKVYQPSDAARMDNLGEMEMLHCGAYKVKASNTMGFYAILRDPAGVFYAYDILMGNASSYNENPVAVKSVRQSVLPDATQQILQDIFSGNNRVICNTGYTDITANALKPCLSYVLISKNNELWLLDRKTGIIVLYDTFDVDITAIDTENYNAWIAGIGLSNGYFYVEEISGPAFLKEVPRRMYSSKTRFGKEIISLRFKNKNAWV